MEGEGSSHLSTELSFCFINQFMVYMLKYKEVWGAELVNIQNLVQFDLILL